MLKRSGSSHPLAKRCVFITGAPRSGTSMTTKVIDAHEEIAILMENIFQNRRRHWMRAVFWQSSRKLRKKVSKAFLKLNEPVIGNKVCTPDVWSVEDIIRFCRLFNDFKIVFLVRDPVQVVLSRYKRERSEIAFNESARQYILLDFRSRFLTYTSSWRQSIENYWRLRDGYPDNVLLVYYDDFCDCFDLEAKRMFKFLDIEFSNNIYNWHQYSHHDKNGNLVKDLKYSDRPVKRKNNSISDLPEKEFAAFNSAIESIEFFHDLWKRRNI